MSPEKRKEYDRQRLLDELFKKPKKSLTWSCQNFLDAFKELWGSCYKGFDDVAVSFKRPVQPSDFLRFPDFDQVEVTEIFFIPYEKFLAVARIKEHIKSSSFLDCCKSVGIYERILYDLHSDMEKKFFNKKNKQLSKAEDEILKMYIAVQQQEQTMLNRLLIKQRGVIQGKLHEQRPSLKGFKDDCSHMHDMYMALKNNEQCQRINRRMKAIECFERGGQLTYERKTYAMPSCVQSAAYRVKRTNLYPNRRQVGCLFEELVVMEDHNAVPTDLFFTTCYGSQLQQALHQECLSLLGACDTFNNTNSLDMFKEGCTDLVRAAMGYNHQGDFIHSARIADFCWAMVDYSTIVGNVALQTSKAVLKGIVAGSCAALVTVALGAAFGELCVVATVCCLTWTAGSVMYDLYADPEGTLTSWEKTCRELTPYDVIEEATAFGVSMLAPNLFSRGISKLGNSLKRGAKNFLKKNPTANLVDYMATPEGVVLKGALGKAVEKGEQGLASEQELKNAINKAEDKICEKILKGQENKIAESIEKNLKNGVAKTVEPNIANATKRIRLAPEEIIRRYASKVEDTIQKFKNDFNEINMLLPDADFFYHVLDRHYASGSDLIARNGMKRSLFNAGEDCVEIAINAWKNGVVTQARTKVCDMGRIIGTTSQGSSTSWVKVVERELGGFLTLFPIEKV
jgi:hypothetical protein